jgi:hypothetical protein
LISANDEAVKRVTLGYEAELRAIVGAVSQLDGAQAEGAFVAGLCQSAGGALRPFVMLPTDSAGDLIESLEGDPQLESPTLDFGGQQVVAIRREGWLALCDADAAECFASEAPRAKLQQMGATATVACQPLLWEYLAAKAQELREADSRWYYRTRRLSTPGGSVPRSVVDLWDLLTAGKPLVDHLAATKTSCCVAIELAEEVRASIVLGRGDLVAASASAAPVDSLALPVAAGEATIAEAAAVVDTAWLRWGLRNYLIAQQAWSEELQIQRGRSQHYDQFVAQCDQVAAMVTALSAAATLPADGAPPMANQAVVLRCDNSTELLEAIDQSISIWNEMATSEMRRTKFVFDTIRGKIGGIESVTYSVDLQAAWLASDVADVKSLMAKLFGNNGQLSYAMVPIDQQHVLVSQLPKSQTERLVERYKNQGLASGEDKRVIKGTFSPQNYRQWIAQQYAIEFADSKHGPQAKLIDSAERLQFEATSRTADGHHELAIEVTAPEELLRQWLAEFWEK